VRLSSLWGIFVAGQAGRLGRNQRVRVHLERGQLHAGTLVREDVSNEMEGVCKAIAEVDSELKAEARDAMGCHHRAREGG